MLGINPFPCTLCYVIIRFCNMLTSSVFSLYEAIELPLLCVVENYCHNSKVFFRKDVLKSEVKILEKIPGKEFIFW